MPSHPLKEPSCHCTIRGQLVMTRLSTTNNTQSHCRRPGPALSLQPFQNHQSSPRKQQHPLNAFHKSGVCFADVPLTFCAESSSFVPILCQVLHILTGSEQPAGLFSQTGTLPSPTSDSHLRGRHAIPLPSAWVLREGHPTAATLTHQATATYTMPARALFGDFHLGSMASHASSLAEAFKIRI